MYTNDYKLSKKYFKLGFGTSQIGGASKFANKQVGMGSQNIQDSISAINYAIKSGINFFDTSDIYGNGRAEKLLGKTIAHNKNVIFCTKYGNRFINNKYYFDTSADYLLSSCQSSCKRLKRNYLDIYLLHSPPENLKLSNKYIKTIDQLINKKTIRSFGVSAKSVNYAINYIKQYDFIDYLEVIYNIADRRAEDKLFEICEKKNVRIIARIPFASGYLLSKNLNRIFKKNDFRSNTDINFKDWIFSFHENYKKMNFHQSVFNNALRFCISNKYVSVVIPGMRNIKQIKYNLNNFNKGVINRRTLKKISSLPKFYYGWK